MKTRNSQVSNGNKSLKNTDSIPPPSDGVLAPIARTEEMSDDLSEETIVNGDISAGSENSTISTVINTSTPKKSWRLSNHFVNKSTTTTNRTLEGAADPEPPWWSDEDDDEKTDRTGELFFEL